MIWKKVSGRYFSIFSLTVHWMYNECQQPLLQWLLFLIQSNLTVGVDGYLYFMGLTFYSFFSLFFLLLLVFGWMGPLWYLPIILGAWWGTVISLTKRRNTVIFTLYHVKRFNGSSCVFKLADDRMALVSGISLDPEAAIGVTKKLPPKWVDGVDEVNWNCSRNLQLLQCLFKVKFSK